MSVISAIWNAPELNRQSAEKILTKLRFKLNDTTINKFSDTELMVALNEGIQLLWFALAANYSTITHKIKEYELVHNIGALLPDDFYTLVELKNLDYQGVNPRYLNIKIFDRSPGNVYRFEPRIEGGYVYGDGRVKLVYNYMPKEITLISEPVDVPIAMVPDILSVVANIVNRQMDLAREAADAAAKRISQYREYAQIPRKVAFP